MKDIDVEVLYGFNVNESYIYLKDNKKYDFNFNKEDIKEIKFSCLGDAFILLSDGTLYKNDEKLLFNINTLGYSCGIFMYAISNDKVIYILDNSNKFICNDYKAYKKIIIDPINIVALTIDNKIRVAGTLVDAIINYENYFDVDDINYLVNEDEIVISKNNKIIGLFNNEDYTDTKDDILTSGSEKETIIL